MMRVSIRTASVVIWFYVSSGFVLGAPPDNLLADPSFEVTKERDQFGLVFAKWGGWKYEGECEFRVGDVAHRGKHSCLLSGGAGAKIRLAQNVALEPGRYRITAYLRGLDITTGTYNASTEFMFDGKYIQLNKRGTFGWTKLTYVGEIKQKKRGRSVVWTFCAGFLWIDDVTLEPVGAGVALTQAPLLGREESPIAPPGPLSADAIRCSQCAYRNNPAWKFCYACGVALQAKKPGAAAPAVKTIATFEKSNPFSGGEVVAFHASEGRNALRIDKGYASMEQSQDWLGYDFLKADLFNSGPEPLNLYVEVRDTATRDYWTRVNYSTVAPPGKSILIIPVKQLFVGEKSRPGRMLILNAVTRLVFSIGEKPPRSLFMDNLRLERDDTLDRVSFDGLFAFDFGTATSPVMEGFTAITPATQYSRGRGYGLKDARVWRAFDAAPTRAAVPGFPLHRIRRLGRRRAQWPLSRVREYRQSLRFLGRVPDLPQPCDRGRRAAGGSRDDGFRYLQEKILPVLERRRSAGRQHIRQVSENLLQRETVRRAGARWPVEPGIPGGKLGLLRVGRGDLSRRAGGQRRGVSPVYGSPPAVLLR